MSEASPSAPRSLRDRKPSQRYLQNPYTDFDLSDEEIGEQDEASGEDSRDGNDVFDPEVSDDEPLEGSASVAALADDDYDDDEFLDEPDENHEAHDDLPDQDTTEAGQTPIKDNRWPYKSSNSTSFRFGPYQARGLLDPRTRASKESNRHSLFGPDPKDQTPALQGFYRWRSEMVLPSRKPDRSGAGGYHRTFYVSDAQRNKEMVQDWAWYDEGKGHEAFRRLQLTEEIDADTASMYLCSDKTDQQVIMGPLSNQRSIELPYACALDLTEPFIPEGQDPETPLKPSMRRNGWLLNLGERIQAVAWAPNNDSTTQYLAVSTMPFQHIAEAGSDMKRQNQSFFHPQRPAKSAIQVWQIGVDDSAGINLDQPPRLRQVICTEGGDIRSLKWCIVPRMDSEEGLSGKHLGLLAGVWTDGAIRILDITVPSSTAPTQYLALRSAAFLSRPPHGVFTSVAWLSSHGICGGMSNGSVAVFDIPLHLESPSVSQSAKPVVCSQLQSSYINSLTSCYPSRPQMLCTNSVSGFLSLTDLSRVTTSTGFNPSNTVFSPRSRLGRVALAWHDWSQMLLTCDDTGMLHGLPLRRFFGYTGLARFRTTVTALAASECHPFIAATGVGGDVSTLNPMRRAVYAKGEMWVLRWFNHEWRRAKFNVGGKGLVRIVEGFRAETMLLVKPGRTSQATATTPAKKAGRGGKKRAAKSRPPPGLLLTIHEAQSAATAVAWNPNLRLGGWIAAGLGSGLLRIEDVGVPA
ncbi:hypothetical protein ANO11243_061120 [Dothideomycetidae sp. 11243]|nr:hypothetical protein ANO11243_061120 [fungal sp. No.11243]